MKKTDILLVNKEFIFKRGTVYSRNILLSCGEVTPCSYVKKSILFYKYLCLNILNYNTVNC